MKFLKIIENLFLLYLLKLNKTHVSVDLENGLDDYCCVIYAKSLFGKTYITKRLLYKDCRESIEVVEQDWYNEIEKCKCNKCGKTFKLKTNNFIGAI